MSARASQPLLRSAGLGGAGLQTGARAHRDQFEVPSLSITWRVPGPALAHIAKTIAVPEQATSAVVECRVSPAAGVVLCVRFVSSRGTGVPPVSPSSTTADRQVAGNDEDSSQHHVRSSAQAPPHRLCHAEHVVELLRLRPAQLRVERDEHGFTHLDADGLVAISVADDARVSYVRTDLSTRLGLPGGTYAAPAVTPVQERP